MIVSILQRFGFRVSQHAGEPLQSRADQNTRKAESGGQPGRKQATSSVKVAPVQTGKAADKPGDLATGRSAQGKAGLSDSSLTRRQSGDAPKAASERRHIVKAPAKKSKAPAKAVAKAAVKAKSAPKAAATAVGKAVKKAVKPAAKAKPASSPVAKKSAKVSPPKKSAPVASKKAVAQPPAKTKVAAKPAKSSKPVAKSITKPAAKAPTKPVAKDDTVVKVSSTLKAPPVAMPVPPAPAPAPQSVLRAPPPLKPGRRSSARTATQSPPPAPMVPTHAPDAAKASYSIMTERVIAPPIQAAAKKDPKLANNWKTKSAEQLTDEEVKAMPDSEYMNEKQMAFFRHKLSVLKQEIHNSAGETTEHLREDTVVVPDPADRATIEEEHALELRTRDRERKLLKKIEQSIARIDSGDYGYCDETGEPIGVGRLIARPTANLSLEAQQRRELKQKMFGD
jgi:DnaK suppressor protein